MKQMLFTFSGAFLFFVSPIAVFAGVDTGVMQNPPVSEAEIMRSKEEAVKKDQQILSEAKNVDPTHSLGEFYYLNITSFKQVKPYYCGPASALQTLSFHKSESGSKKALPSQSTLAKKIGTEKSKASSSYGIRDALNAYKSTFGFSSYPYVVADLTNTSDPEYTFEARIKYDLRNGIHAPILLVNTKHLKIYKGTTLRHYVTTAAYTYDYFTQKKQIKYADLNYKDAYYGQHYELLGSKSS
jgi:hypothetical protein